MTAAVDRLEEPRADVGWIVGATINVLRLRALDITIVGIVFVWLPTLLIGLAPPDQSVALRALAGLLAVPFFGGVSLIACQEMTGGERVTALRALRVGVTRYVTFFLINAVSTLMALVGLVLLVAPGIFVLAAFMAATTIAAAEGKGSTAALERAWLLSRGSRGRLAALIGLALVSYLIMLLAAIVIAVAVQLIAGGSLTGPVSQLVLGPIISTVLVAITTVGSAAAYVNLRSIKEGRVDVADTFA